MKTFTKLALCALTIAGTAVVSAEPVNIPKPGFMRAVIGKATYENNQIKTTDRAMLLSSEVFDIDVNKKYSYKLTISGNGQKRVFVYLGYNILDAKGRAYSAACWQGLPDTFTQVTKAAKKGDTVIYVKDGKNWRKVSSVYFVLNAKQDNSDIPNVRVVRCAMQSKVQKGNEWEITLAKPLTADIAAGTNIRQHADGGYFYVHNRGISAGQELTLSGTVQGMVTKLGGFNGKNWPLGAKKVRLLMLLDWTGTKTGVTIKDATFTIE